MLDKEIVSVKDFKGLLIRGIDPINNVQNIQGKTPFDYAFDSSNLIFLKDGGLRSRDGFERYIVSSDTASPFTALGVVTGLWKINNLLGVDYADRWLILTYNSGDDTGRFYDTGVVAPATNPVLSLTGMKYAFVINAFGRMYISPWAAFATPLGAPNGNIHLYNGSYNARKAGGLPPTAGTFSVTATAGGNATVGLHYASVIFETDSGFRTYAASGHDLTPLTVTTTAANATMSFANIPVGAANSGVIKRHIIITKVVVNPNGQGLKGYEPFITATIDDNTTTVATYGGPDSNLVDSAKDYVYGSIYIRAHVSMAQYGTRMVYLGSRALTGAALSYLKNTIAVSKPSLPEHVYDVYGYIGERNILIVGEGYTGQVMSGLELNGVFYIFKDSSTHAVIDNPEDDPMTWPVALIDAGKGGYPFGVGLVGNNPSGLVSGGALVIGNHGISYFNGRHSENTLTANIWDNFVSKLPSIRWSRLMIDTTRKLVFWVLGDPIAGDYLYTCYTMNYENGLNPDTVKFGTWEEIRFNYNGTMTCPAAALRPPNTYGTVTPSYYFNTNYPLLTFAFREPSDSKIYMVSEASSVADGFYTNLTDAWAIVWRLRTGFTPNESGEIYQFSHLRLRGSVNFEATIPVNYGYKDISLGYIILDNNFQINLTPIVNPGKAPQRFLTVPINAKAEQISLNLLGTSRVTIQQLILFGSQVGLDRPR